MIEQIIVLSLTVIGVCCMFWDGMIFEKAMILLKVIIGEWWAKPFFGCYVCSTFWWGGLMAFILGWPIWYAIPAMGLSAVISLLQKD